MESESIKALERRKRKRRTAGLVLCY